MPNVSTFTEFVNALTSINTGDVINITADLDFNTWLPSAGLTFPLHCPSDSHQVENVIINGNGHTIYNLTNSYSGRDNDGTFAFHVLTGKECIQINNLNFLNCSCMSEKPVFTVNVNQSTTYPSIGIYDSTIQGAFSYSPFFNNFWCVRCMITIQSNTGTFVTTADNTNPIYKQCWIYLNNISKTSTRAILPKLDQCYVKGSINYAALGAANQLAITTSCNNSCINVSADVSPFSFNVPLSTIVRQWGDKKSIVNTDKLVGTTASTDERTIAVTDEQMRDADYLYNLGFEILPTQAGE